MDVRGAVERHPEWWMIAASAAAWGWIVMLGRGHAAHHAMHGMHAADAHPLALQAAAWGAMVVAMMFPLTVAGVRHVARAAESGWARQRAIAGFLGGYALVWLAAGTVVVAAVEGASMLAGRTAAALAIALLAAAWEVAPGHRTRLRRCHHHAALLGRAACARFGAENGLRCVVACWALMAACAAFAHALPVMAVLFGVQVSGRYRRGHSPALAAAAVLGVCLFALGLRR